jgi:hypothetical protein
VVGKGAQEFEFKVETLERAAHGWGQARNELECEHCGARTSVPPGTLAHSCLFCGSNKVIQRQAPQDMLRPRFVIPFKVDSQECINLVRTWLGSNWMTPASLRQLADLSVLTGIYLPYWTFDAVTSADWKAEVGHTKIERYRSGGEWKTRTVTEWRWESGHVEQSFDDILVEGTARISRLLLSRVDNFNLQDLAPYEPDYLAGLHAQAYDVVLEEAWQSARGQMRDQTRLACRNQASTPRIRNFSMTLDFSSESWRYILLPVYLAPYRYLNETYQVIVNGQTGSIAGQRPVDWRKIWLVVAAIVSPGLLLSVLGALLSVVIGPLMASIGVGALVIGLIVSLVLILRARGMDDV